MASVFLEDKNKTIDVPDDMAEEDVQFLVDTEEYNKSPELSLMHSVLQHPISNTVSKFFSDMMPIEDWEKAEKVAKDAFMAVPKLFFSSVESATKTATLQDTTEADEDISEAAMVLGQEIFKSYVRIKEPIRPLVSGIINKESVGDIAKDVTKSVIAPEKTETIVSETIPMTDWEREGGAARLIPRAIGEAVESVLVYSSFLKDVPKLIEQGQVAQVRNNVNRLGERLKDKLISEGYSEEKAVRILMDKRVQDFIRETPVFKDITGQGITRMYSAGLPDFTPGQVLKLAEGAAKVIKQEGKNITLSIAGKEIVKNVDELKFTGVSQPTDIPKKKTRGFVKSVQEEMPDVKVAGMYMPRSTDKLAIQARTLIKDDIAAAESMAKSGTNDESIAVGAELLKHYSSLAQKTKSPEVADAIYEKATELGNDMAERLTDLGRSVQAASILTRMTPEGQIRFAAKTIKKYNKEVQKAKGGVLGLKRPIPELTKEQTKEIIEMTDEISKLPDGDAKAMKWRNLQNYISDLVPTPLFKKIVSIWKAGLLTGLKTSGLNIMSNYSHAFGTEVLKDIPAVAIDSIASLFTKERTFGLTVKGLKGGFKEGTEKGWRFLKTGYDERNIGSKYDYKRVNFGKGKFAKAMQAYEQSIFRVLGAEDQPFYYGAKARSLYSQAIAQAKNKGLKGKDKKEFIEQLVKNPTDDMVVIAVGDAETAVFQNRTALGAAANKIQETGAGEFVVPFGRTPSAFAMQIINYTPVGAVKKLFENVGKGKFNQKDFSQGMGRATMGVGILALGAYMFRKDMILLDYPTSETERRLWEMEGKKPNSIKLGGKYRSANTLGPGGNVLLIGGQFQNAFDESGSPTEAISKAMAGSAKAFSEQTFLTGISQASKAITDPERSAERYAAGMVASIIPTIINDVAKSIDPKDRRSDTIADRVVSRIPGLRQSLEPRVDVLGADQYTRENFLEKMADPTRPKTAIEDPVVDEIRRLVDQDLPISLSRLGGRKGYDVLTPKQNTDLWRRAGQMAYDKIDALMQYEHYEELPDDERAKKIDEYIDKAKVIARVEKMLEITEGLSDAELPSVLSEAKESGLLNRTVYEKYKILR